MTTVISTINLKGGVGKTSITVALAEFLADEHRKKVLMIDLDPQTNATVTLMDENDWKVKDTAGETLLQLFKDKVEKTSKFSIDKALVKGASKVGNGISRLDLLPSSLGLIEIQDQLAMVPSGHFFVTSPVSILYDAVNPILNNYDFVLIDCPPNLGIVTLNGINISDFYIIPAIPDVLSTYGIPQILSRIKSFIAEKKGEKPTPLGIVVSMYRKQSHLHESVLNDLKTKAADGTYPRVFNTIIPLTVRISESADFTTKANTLKQKYGYGTAYEDFRNLTKEMLTYV
jgi:chromosome partitioning protein